jgi:hypothetical protein
MGQARGRWSRVAAVAVLAVLAAAVGRTGVADDAVAPIVIADFEDPACLESVRAHAGAAEIVEPPATGGGRALRWTLAPSGAGKSSYLDLPVAAPPDLAKYRFLQFRIRLEGKRPGALEVRLENESGAYLSARVRGAGADWKTMSFDLESMDRDGKFDPAAVAWAAFIVFDSAAGSYLLDDVALVAKPSPQAVGPVGKAPAAGAKASRRVVADFEAAESEDFVDAHRCTAARVPAGPKETGSVLAWTLRAATKSSYVEIYGIPADVRECRTLRFRIRADRPVTQSMSVRLEASTEDVLDAEVKGIAAQWKTVEMRLPEMDVMGEFDPRRVRDLSFIFFEPPDAVVQIDDVELETAAGGWRLTEPEMLVHAFGESRAKKVAKIPTKHFEIYTDSAAAQGKFPKALETAYEFSKKTLGLPEMDEPLPIYIFQNSNLYFDFAVRFAHWTKEEAEASAGHGSGRYFATYYQSPDAPTVIHELTHSLFHRTRGAMGGSWFQEGVAVYVEHVWQHQSAAEIFSANLRSGQFVRLADFMAIPVLLDVKDAKGGPRTADRLYLQAGAFYEFLVRGPLADAARGVIPVLARIPKSDEETPAFVANLFGLSLDEIEKQWIAWGSEPPKAK